MGGYVTRLVDRYLEELIDQIPAFIVVGPRASGKDDNRLAPLRDIAASGYPVECRRRCD